jgi:hypothetical protein
VREVTAADLADVLERAVRRPERITVLVNRRLERQSDFFAGSSAEAISELAVLWTNGT